MKTLYISDLDGTLLNDSAAVSDYSRAALKRMTDDGAFFTVATARTAATVPLMLAGAGVNVPVVLMNGVCVCDIATGRYLKVERIDDAAKSAAQAILERHGLFGFWYAVGDGGLSTYYVRPASPAAEAFIREREKMGKKFIKIERFSDCLGEPLVYHSICAPKAQVEAAAAEMKNVAGLRVEFYRDTYLEDHWFFELCADTASKRNAVEFLRRAYGFDRIVGFGDNLNDLPLFEACDESCAVSNAVQAVREKATRVIGANTDDGVARWMESDVDAARRTSTV